MYPSKATEAASAVLFQRRQEARQRAMDRQNDIYALHPEFRALDRKIRGLAGGIAAAALSPDGPEQVERLDAGLASLARVLRRDLGADVSELPGAGAAGGMGAGMAAFFRSRLQSGIETVLDTVHFSEVIRDADLLSLEALSAKAKDLAERARSNQLGADEYKGSTFTVSNLGMFGVESFTPIINQPDAAILGVNCTEDELVMEADGTIAKHQVMRISLTYDHRLVDGAVAAKFEMTVRDLLESPMDILL